MAAEIDLTLVLIAAFIATASPGPATLAIAGTAMTSGRRHGLALAMGVTTGSWIWSASAAMGAGAVMFANAWLFEGLRYLGAAYLLYLAFSAARSALSPAAAEARIKAGRSLPEAYAKGLALHLTNPKAVLFFGSLFAVGVPAGSASTDLAVVVLAVGVQSFLIFQGYALLFSVPGVMTAYARLRQGLEAVFAAVFGAAGVRVLTADPN